MNEIGCRIVVGDCLVHDDVVQALRDVDAVVHLVGIKRAAIRHTGLTYRDVDVGSVRTMADAMRDGGPRRILLLSAADIGHSLYVQCKREAEQILRDAGLDWTFFRPAFILGKGQQWPVLLTPFLATFALLPGKFGDTSRRAGCVTREQLAQSMVHALGDDRSIRAVFDVRAIRRAAEAWTTVDSY